MHLSLQHCVVHLLMLKCGQGATPRMDIDDIISESDKPHYTELRPILHGFYNLSQVRIPYFQGLMSLEEVSKELRLVEDLPADLRSQWRLEELFQREIDWDRVRYDIVAGYLRRPEKLKFFNALTVALLPLTDKKLLASEYGEVSAVPELRPSLEKDPWKVTNAGRVQLILNNSSPHGYIRWDPKRIFAATIDGQHRLAALQMLYNNGNLPAAALETRISVIFLVLDPRAGFDPKHLTRSPGENPVLTVVREVFIDLNKHAREVRRSRRILLDDQEIESRCLRGLLAPVVGQRVEGRLPLGIVHWQHNESAKFNTGEKTGPFITTVELLYSIIQDILELSTPKDPLDDKQVRAFVNSLEEALKISEFIARDPVKYPNLPPLMSYVEELHLKPGFEVPFANLNAQYLRVCDDAFAERWRPLILGVLTGFKPYKKFIEEVEKRGGIDGDLAFYLVLPKRAQKTQSDEWGELRREKIDKPLQELAGMKTKDWPFFAVFQKALLRATARAWSNYSILAGAKEFSISSFLESWLGFLNELSDRGVFALKATLPDGTNERVWVGIGLNVASESVRYNNSAVERLTGLLLLWWYFHLKRLTRPKQFLKQVDQRKKYPKALEAAQALRRGLESVVERKEEFTEAQVEEAVEQRLERLIALAKHSASMTEDQEDQENSAPGEQPPEASETP
jgi:hypothetical protein